MRTPRQRTLISTVLIGLLITWQVVSRAQLTEQDLPSQLAKPGTRFNFEVIESFDAKYLGDTPGHMGRAGGLGDKRPRISLGDPVFRENAKVGIVSAILWQRVQGSLGVEFDPVPLARISVGDRVWLDLNPSNPVERD